MSSSFQSAYRDQLVAAVGRSPRRRQTGLLAAGVGGAAAALLGAVTLLNPATAQADVEVVRGANRVEVLLKDLQSSAPEVQEALDEANLDVRVEPVPVGPSNVGRFVGDTASEEGLEDVRRSAASAGGFLGFSIPTDWPGTLTVFLGRPAEAGEHYLVTSNAFAPGEPLACTEVLGSPLAEAADLLDGMSVQVRGSLEDRRTTSLAAALASERADWDVADALVIAEGEVLVTVSPTPVDRATVPC